MWLYPIKRESDEGVVADGLLLMGQVKNGKTRIVERTVTTTVGSAWAAVYVYDSVMKKNRVIQSVYYHEDWGDDDGSRIEVDVLAEGMDGILDSIRLTGQDASTNQAIINGE